MLDLFPPHLNVSPPLDLIHVLILNGVKESRVSLHPETHLCSVSGVISLKMQPLKKFKVLHIIKA